MHLFYDITYFVFSNVQVSKPQTCRCQSHIAPASQRRSLSLCKCIKSHHWFWLPASYASSLSLLQMSRDPVGHHWFWLPASYASSLFLLQMFTGPMPQLHFQSGAFSSSSSFLLILLIIRFCCGGGCGRGSAPYYIHSHTC